jgi:cardiolipin synthase
LSGNTFVLARAPGQTFGIGGARLQPHGARMSLREFFVKEWFQLKIRTWLLILLGAAIGIPSFGIFYIRRQLVAYRPAHTFSIGAPEFFDSAHALGDPLPVAGNRIELLENGDQFFPVLLQSIHAAKRSVNFEAYIFSSDGTGRQFRDALIERAQAGVKVRVLLDGIGSSTNLQNSDVEMMKKGGCEFAYFHPALSLRLDHANRRSHRRILVIDGKLGFTGGIGFDDRWSGHADSPEHWRDLAAKIEGPLVAKLQGAFQQHWVKETRKVLSGADDFPDLPAVGPLHCQMTASHAFSVAPLPLTQAVAIAAAEKQISITNAYCDPTEDQIALLTAAAARGVEVRLLVPGKNNDQPAEKAAGRTSYGKLLAGGVQIYEYQPTMIHQKTMVCDSLFGIFGTSNLDARSSQLNEEVDVTVYDAGFGREMESVFEHDLQDARAYTAEDFARRTNWDRFSEWVMQPFRPQL